MRVTVHFIGGTNFSFDCEKEDLPAVEQLAKSQRSCLSTEDKGTTRIIRSDAVAMIEYTK